MKKIFFSLLFCSVLLGCERETVVPDEAITCLNAGIVNGGQCFCPPGYIGEYCEEESTPIKVRIQGISLEKFPKFDANGTSWDPLTAPDIFLTIYKDSTRVFTSSFITDVSDLPVMLTDRSLEFDDLSANYRMKLFDADPDSTNETLDEELIGVLEFQPYTKDQKFPASVTLDCNDCEIAINIQDIRYFY